MSRKIFLLASLIIVFLMTTFETLFLDESLWAWLVLGVLLLGDLLLVYLLSNEIAFRIRRLHAILLVAGLVAVVVVLNILLPTTNDVKDLLGISYSIPALKGTTAPSNSGIPNIKGTIPNIKGTIPNIKGTIPKVKSTMPK